MKRIVVIGMGLSPRDLTGDQLEVIRTADLLVGGRRHLAAFSDLKMEKQTITGRIDETIEILGRRRDAARIVVLASGDPLFFGIGAKILQAFGPGQVTVLPNVSSIAAAFARIHQPWNDARIVSLHGRDRKYDLLQVLKSGGPVAVLTDREQTPDWLAGWLLARGVTHLQMAVCEQMGTSEERVGRYDLARAAGERFAQPNVVILLPDGANAASGGLHLGMPDDAYAHERGLITKSEVRAVTLAKLCLRPGLILWDLGAGSGSVGIEASVLLGAGRVVAVEEKSERIDLIQKNAQRFGVFNHTVVQARLPDGLAQLPTPDRVFIGGGGRDLSEIVQQSAERLAPDGLMVVNTVLVDNMTVSIDALEAAGFETEMVQLQVNRSKPMPWSRRLEASNPVWIVTGRRRMDQRPDER